MNLKNFLISFVATFIVTLVVAVVVSFLYNLIVHGTSAVDWDTSFRLAIMLGIIFPCVRAFESRKKEKTA
jgi:hypothetical protein